MTGEHILKSMEDKYALCQVLPLVQERLFRAGLLKTAHAMDAAVKAVGYETAEHAETLEKGKP